MQPLARRGRRVQGRHQQHERRVRPRRRRDDQRRLRERHQHASTASAGSSSATPTLNADRVLQAGDRREAAARAQPVRRRARRPDRQEPGVLLRRLRGLPAERGKITAFSTIPTPSQRQGILAVDVRDPRTGVVYPAGTPIPMTALRAQGARPACRTPTTGGRVEQLRHPAGVHQRHRQGGRQGRRPGQARPVDVRPLRLARRRHRRPADLPLPSGGAGNGTIYARNKQLALGATWVPERRRCSKCASAGRAPKAARIPPALGSTGALDSLWHLRPADRPAHRRRLPTQIITGYSDLGRQATNPQWQYPDGLQPEGQLHLARWRRTRSRPATSSSASTPRCRTSTRSTAATPTAASSPGRPARRRPTIYNLADFMLGLRSPVRAQQRARRQHAAEHALRLPAGRLARQRPADAEPRPALRVRDAAVGGGQHPLQLRSGDQRDDPGQDGSIDDRALVNPDRNNFGPRLGFAYTLTPKTVVRGGYGVSYIHFNRAGGGNLLPINGPQVINAVVNQTEPTADRRSARPSRATRPG